MRYTDRKLHLLDFNPAILPPILSSEDPIVPDLGERTRLVLCISGGEESDRQAEFTTPRMAEYAARCNAQFVWITTDLSPKNPVWNKYRVSQLAQNFKQTLFLDTDVLVSRTAPDLFDICGDTLGVVNLVPNTSETMLGVARALFAFYGTPCPAKLLNGGVIHFPKSSLPYYTPKTLLRHWCYDQWRFSGVIEACNLPTTWLPDQWNTTPVSPRYTRPQESYFIHAAGVANRVEHLRYLDLIVP